MNVFQLTRTGAVAQPYRIIIKILQQAFTTYNWPVSARNIKLSEGLLVIAVQTLANMPRAEIRLHVRAALQEVLAIILDCSSTEIELISNPGEALRLLHPQHNIGLSISHETGMSLVAINISGKIGVDLMALNSSPSIEEIDALATDYLGGEVAEYIKQLSVESKKISFTRAWTELEARLKCREQTLTEWHLTKKTLLAECITISLTLPAGYIGCLAVL